MHNGKYVRSNKFGYKFGKSYFARLATAIESVRRQLENYDAGEMVIVGHHMGSALHRLRDIGLDIDKNVPLFDTAGLERAWSGRVNGRRQKLMELCEKMDIPYYRRDKMNNAGNDAFFIMAVFNKMCCSLDIIPYHFRI